jgi:hypothetical protein
MYLVIGGVLGDVASWLLETRRFGSGSTRRHPQGAKLEISRETVVRGLLDGVELARAKGDAGPMISGWKLLRAERTQGAGLGGWGPGIRGTDEELGALLADGT